MNRPDENITLPEAAVKPTREIHGQISGFRQRLGGQRRTSEVSREEHSTVLRDWTSEQRR